MAAGADSSGRDPGAEEFDRQAARLLAGEYAELAGLSERAFGALLAPLRPLAAARPPSAGGRFSFVIVVRQERVSADEAITRVVHGADQGFTTMGREELARFKPAEGLAVPEAAAYLALDVDAGGALRGVAPEEAVARITALGRSPLTLEEGLALATHHPEVLKPANGFQMAGSRCGDRRVTGIWLSAQRPRLGWCWAGAPHSWLGAASCAGRLAAAM
jgi:hypothetical protein